MTRNEEATETTTTATHPATALGRVLVVDDEAEVRAAFGRVLGRLGYEVEAVGTGEEAVRRAAGRDYDAALVDLWMPGMNGHETIRALRGVAPRLAAVVLSGMGTEASAEAAKEAGAVRYVGKPASAADLRAAVEEAVEATRRARAAAEFGLAPGWRGRILVADDHDAFRMALVRRLRLDGFDVDEARTGEEAFEKWSPSRYDAALIDYRMPDGDGGWTIRSIRRIDPEASLACMSGEATPEEVNAGAAKADAYYRKPFDARWIGRSLEALIAECREARRARAAEEAWRRLPAIERAARRAGRRARRSWKTRDLPLALGAIAASFLLSFGAAHGIEKADEARRARAEVAAEAGRRPLPGLGEMYWTVVGALERDEAREVRRLAEEGARP